MHRNPHCRFHLVSARRRGAALLLVMIAIGIATTLGLGFLASQAMATSVASNSRNYTRARWIAESGIEITGSYIKNNSDWRTVKTHGSWVSNQSYGGGTLSVSVYDGQDSDGDGVIETDNSLSDDATDPATIVSIGTYNGVTYTARALVSTNSQNTQIVLMIVPNAASLSAADTKRKTVLEANGWTVNLLSESANQADLDDAVEDALVVYISSTVTSSSMLNKLVDLELGIVSEPMTFQDGFGASSSDGTATSVSQITPINSSHFITQGLTLSTPLTITTSAQSMCYMSGSMAPGLLQLATRPSSGTNAMLAVLEDGAATSSGIAAARRVFLPWGASGVDPSTWNSTAIALLDRSLKWAACMDGSGSTSTSRVAVSDYVKLYGSGKIDSFQSSTGAYSNTNNGVDAVVSTNAATSAKIYLANTSRINGRVEVGVGGNAATGVSINNSAVVTGAKTVQTTNYPLPTASAPTNMGYNIGSLTKSSGTTVISADKHYYKLTLSGTAILQISGKRIILCDNSVSVSGSAQIQMLSGSSLTLYAKRSVVFQDSARVNVNTANPGKLLMYCTSSKSGTYVQGTGPIVYANVVIPYQTFYIKNGGQLCGSVMGKRVYIQDNGILSVDTSSTTVIPVTGGTTYSATFSYLP